MIDLELKDIEVFAEKMKTVVKGDAITHICLLKTDIETLFDGGYNGPGSLPFVKIVGGKEDGGYWAENLKERAEASEGLPYPEIGVTPRSASSCESPRQAQPASTGGRNGGKNGGTGGGCSRRWDDVHL